MYYHQKEKFIKMTTLCLKVHMHDEGRKIQNFSQDQWDEVCIIFEKLVRNIKIEYPDLIIDEFDKSEIPYVTMRVDMKEGSEISDDQLTYVFDYLSGEHTDNPVYLPDGIHLVNSEIIVENEDEGLSLLDKLNLMVKDVGI